MDRGLGYRWTLDDMFADDAAERSLSGAVRVEPLVARVLLARGVDDAPTAGAFLEPRLTGLHDPALLPGAVTGAERILDAINKGEPIAIYGDYDADGVCATAVLTRVIRAVAESLGRPDFTVTGYIPHRLDEGYGLNAGALTELARDHKLIISCDCGVTGADAARALEGTGTDLIVTDHHNIENGSVPECVAIVHPRIDWGDGESGSYPFGELCGAGVAFKLMWRLGQIANEGDRVADGVRAALLQCLPLVAIATVADIVPLVDENRVLAKHGLGLMRQTDIVGLRALLEASGLAGASVDAEGAGFKLAPRLNAAGRLGHARVAYELFMTDDEARAAELAEGLSKTNTERQKLERGFASEAMAKAEASGMTGDGRRAIVLWDEGWHPGVIGIVCSRLVREHGRPVVLCGMVDGVLKGSGRSIDGYNLHAGLSACADHLKSFGGHDMAAGVALEPERFEGFASALLDHADTHIDDAMLTPALRVDVAASLGEFTIGAARSLERLGPFGRANREPKVLVRGLTSEQTSTMGQNAKHLQIRARNGEGAGTVRLVGWSKGDLADRVPRGQRFDAIVTPKINRFRGVESVEAELHDLRLA